MKKFVKRLSLLILSLAVVLNIFNVSCDAVTKKKKNLFFTYQSLSCLCATAIALGKSKEVNDIVVSGGAHRGEKTIAGLKKVFDHVYIDDTSKLTGSYDCVYSAGLPTSVKNEKFESYVHKGAKGMIYDEGLTAYIGYPVSCQNLSNASALMLPTYRAGTLKQFPCEEISRENLLKAVQLLYNPSPIKKDIVFCLACSGRPEFNARTNKNILDILKNYKNVAVKCHPIDGRKFLFPQNIEELDRGIPFEKFYYGFNGILIANLNSTLLTAKFMQPDSTVICTEFLNKSKEEIKNATYCLPGDWNNVIKMLKELGVLFPKTLAELKSMISQNINKI